MYQILRAILALMAFCLAAKASAADGEEKQAPAARILFICEHGNVKSLMAASYFNQIARERHLPFLAVSRGIEPDSTTVPPVIVEGLRADGLDVAAFHPIKVNASDVDSARRVIAISVLTPIRIGSNSASILTWDDVPPATLDFKSSGKSIKAHIEELITQLATEKN